MELELPNRSAAVDDVLPLLRPVAAHHEDDETREEEFSLPPVRQKTVSFWEEWRAQARTALPALASMLLYRIPWLISLRFAGTLGADELAAAALASTLCNVTGLSLSVGLSSGLTTLAGQARGHLLRARQLSEKLMLRKKGTIVRKSQSADTVTSLSDTEEGADVEDASLQETGLDSASNSTSSTEAVMPLVFLFRGTFIQLVFVVPVGVWWLFGIEPLLLFLGQGAQLSAMTQDYLRILTPGLWSYSINWTLTSWLQTMEMSDVPAYAAGCGLVAHIPLNFFFINVMDWGYLGVAAATVSFQIIQPCVMIAYLLTEAGSKRLWQQMGAIEKGSLRFWPAIKVAVSKGIGQYLGLALPGIVIISEWWASEVAIFLSGRLDDPSISLGAMTLYQSINSFCFMFPTGIAIAGSARVSTWLGAGRFASASKASVINIACAGCISAVLGSVLYMTPHSFFPSLFAPDQVELYSLAGELMPLLAVYVFADGITSALNGTIKGCGRQVIVMPVVVVAYWLVGLPLAYHWAFNDQCSVLCGDVGLVAGMLTGTWIHMLVLAVLVGLGTNWELEAQKARQRMMAEKVEDD